MPCEVCQKIAFYSILSIFMNLRWNFIPIWPHHHHLSRTISEKLLLSFCLKNNITINTENWFNYKAKKRELKSTKKKFYSQNVRKEIKISTSQGNFVLGYWFILISILFFWMVIHGFLTHSKNFCLSFTIFLSNYMKKKVRCMPSSASRRWEWERASEQRSRFFAI